MFFFDAGAQQVVHAATAALERFAVEDVDPDGARSRWISMAEALLVLTSSIHCRACNAGSMSLARVSRLLL